MRSYHFVAEVTFNEFLKLGDVEISKMEFYCSKKVIVLNNVDVQKILVSNEFAYGKNKETNEKYFIRYIKRMKK